tara:strand:+ start:1173 stop:2231 length:1059 start_codon:yes stop_codon:yes gene_type:complete
MKTMNTMKTLSYFLLSIIFILSGCKKDDPTPLPAETGKYESGYFIINEGNFGTGNGSISFIDENGNVENNSFELNNSFLLGDVVQSMRIINDNAYIVVNNSANIKVASANNMQYTTTIDAVSPRYIAQVSSDKAYITDWGINGVHILDLQTNSIISTISCGIGPEGIAVNNGYAYVCNVGAWGLDNTVSVINIATDMVETTLSVGDKPGSAVVDINGAVWILSSGYTEYDPNDWSIISQTAGSLVKIVDNNIVSTFTFEVGNSPSDLVINDLGTDLYFTNGAVYTMNISDNQLPTNPLINRSFYGLGFNNGYIYGADAVDFTQQGWSYRFTNNGNIIDSVQVGIIPNGYCFN